MSTMILGTCYIMMSIRQLEGSTFRLTCTQSSNDEKPPSRYVYCRTGALLNGDCLSANNRC